MNQAVLLFSIRNFRASSSGLVPALYLATAMAGGSDCRDGLLHCSDDDLQRALLFFRRRILHFNVTKHPTS
jgi:hypothetical protein